jgi:putative ABC transport system permease protein
MPQNLEMFLRDLKSAARSLGRAKGLSIAVILTLALGIGANAAMFSLVRGVLLRPLVNRDESKLIYIRQSANGGNAWFSVPEIQDIESRSKTLTDFGDFSTLEFTLLGLGEPRTVQAGVVGGSYFQTMGLRPVLGRLLDSHDDGPNAAGAAVLTYRFWSTSLNRDPSVIGKTIRLGSFIDTRTATIVGVLEPCVPYPQETEIISNIVTSSHHLSATMVQGRIHRMTELFARLAPGATLEQARAELDSVYKSMKSEHPEAYPSRTDYEISATRLRDELTSGARTILLVLMAASILVFVIACCNVANLILARNVRRESELAIRAALGASTRDLRRLLLAESVLLCTAGAVLGLLVAQPLLNVLGQYASRFSLRALDLTMDLSMLWVGAGLAVLAAALLAFVPRLPASGATQGIGLAAASTRMTGGTNRKLKAFALVQIAACFVLVAASAATVKTLLSLETVRARFETRHVLAVNVPVMRDGRSPTEIVAYYQEAMRQIRQQPGVVNVALGSSVPWRDKDIFKLEFAADGRVPGPDEKHPIAIGEVISPGFFTTLGLPILAGRDFEDSDRADSEPVALVSQSLADQMFPNGNAIGHHVLWTDPVLKFIPTGVHIVPLRIVGIVPDIDNQDFVPRPTVRIYQPMTQDPILLGERLLVDVSSDPYAQVQPITKIMRKLYANQPVERARTIEDIRTEVLSPERLNAVISAVFAVVSLLIAIVGVAGVLAFSVSARTREFGIRLAIGSQPRDILMRVLTEGTAMAVGGLLVGLICGFGLGKIAAAFMGDLKMPGIAPLFSSALILLIAAVTASAMPAIRAARVNVIEALRTE